MPTATCELVHAQPCINVDCPGACGPMCSCISSVENELIVCCISCTFDLRRVYVCECVCVLLWVSSCISYGENDFCLLHLLYVCCESAYAILMSRTSLSSVTILVCLWVSVCVCVCEFVCVVLTQQLHFLCPERAYRLLHLLYADLRLSLCKYLSLSLSVCCCCCCVSMRMMRMKLRASANTHTAWQITRVYILSLS